MSTRINYQARGRVGFTCTLSTQTGLQVVLTKEADPEVAPMSEGDHELLANPAFMTNLWGFSEQVFLYRKARAEDKRKSHHDQADKHKRLVLGLAQMIEALGSRQRQGWCSACFDYTGHRQLQGWHGTPPAYLCDKCGSATTPCAAVRCSNMANRGVSGTKLPRYCAEHRHDIPGFAKLGEQLKQLDDYEDWLKFEKRNLARATRITLSAAGAAAVVGPAALFAAPAIGGILGASSLGGSLTGAAATSHGLAMLGGGSIAAGGAGMAGGTFVLTAAGGALGGGLGAVTTSAYVRQDDSFRIEKLRDGEVPSVLLANGFLTEGTRGWGGWRRMIDTRYPNATVYRVHWGSKELKAFGSLAAAGSGKAAAAKFAAKVAARATRSGAAKIPWLGRLLTASDLIANPWNVAKTRADMTGAVLADIIARTEGHNFVLVGHSLGARVMLTAAQALGSRGDTPKLDAVHLLGTAASSKGDWRALNESVHAAVWNYRSDQDTVLRYVYRTVQVGQTALGVTGFKSKFPKVKDRNVTRTVKSHSMYFSGVKLR